MADFSIQLKLRFNSLAKPLEADNFILYSPAICDRFRKASNSTEILFNYMPLSSLKVAFIQSL